jgi:hypothetical protein
MDEERAAVLALQEQYRSLTTGGALVCARCGQVFVHGDESTCSYHCGDYVATESAGAETSSHFTCCQAREDIFWGGAPLYDSLVPLVRNKLALTRVVQTR